MAQGNFKRKRLYVSKRIQGYILYRLALYWIIYHVALWICVSWDGLLLSVGESLGGVGDVPSRSVYMTFFLYSSVSCAVAVLPFVLWDMLKITHRVAGPLYRLKTVLDQLARGEQVESIHFRRGDLLMDVEESFNRFLASRAAADASQPAADPEPLDRNAGGGCFDEDERVESIEADLNEIQETLEDAEPAPPVPAR